MGEGDAEVEAPAFMPGEDVHSPAKRVLRETAMDEETVFTIEAEGLPVCVRYRPADVEAALDTGLLWLTSLHEVFFSRWRWRARPP